jgi:hypothetical protein
MSATKDWLGHPVTALPLSQSVAIVAVLVGAVTVEGVQCSIPALGPGSRPGITPGRAAVTPPSV